MKRGKQIGVVVPLKDGNYVMLNFHRGVDGIYTFIKIATGEYKTWTIYNYNVPCDEV